MEKFRPLDSKEENAQMFFTADQLVAHLVGDYIIQSHWMSVEKARNSVVAGVHALTYTIPFLFITGSWQALGVILVTHFIIDRWRLARYLVWFKNQMAPTVS